ncbi:MAG: glycosyltransferase family 39 protein, partial [Patescibacteria group bacterium]
LSDFPVGFHIDEASLGYNGYSLLYTGKDDNGNRLPLYIDMFGDNRPSGYHYLTVPSIKLLGLNEFSTRFPGALIGSITIFAIFFFVITIFQDKKLGLISAFLVAISPWHFVLSRASSEAIVSLFFIIIGFSLFFYSLQKQKKLYLLIGSISMIASFFFYHSPRVFVPGLFLVFILMFLPIIKKLQKKYKIVLFFCLIFVLAIAAFLVFAITGGTGRYSQINIFSSFETDFFQKQQIQEDAVAGSNNIVSRLFHNKATNIFLIFVSNYFDYFGFNFLFTTGGLPIWYNVPRMGLLYIVELPFILIGIYNVLRRKNLYFKIPLVWLLVAPIVPAITMDDIPNINRAIVMFPMLEIIAGIGFLSFIGNIKLKKPAIVLVTLLLIFNSLYFLHQYFYNAKTHKPWYRNNGFSEMMNEVKKKYDKYDLVAMSKYQGGIYPLVLFYMQYDPNKYQEEGSPKNKDYGGFGKFFFVPQDCPSLQSRNRVPDPSRTLYVDKGDCPLDKSIPTKRSEYIYREDGTKAFRIVYD